MHKRNTNSFSRKFHTRLFLRRLSFPRKRRILLILLFACQFIFMIRKNLITTKNIFSGWNFWEVLDLRVESETPKSRISQVLASAALFSQPYAEALSYTEIPHSFKAPTSIPTTTTTGLGYNERFLDDGCIKASLKLENIYNNVQCELVCQNETFLFWNGKACQRLGIFSSVNHTVFMLLRNVETLENCYGVLQQAPGNTNENVSEIERIKSKEGRSYCEANCEFNGTLPFLHSLDGTESELGPAARQLMRSLTVHPDYLDRARRNFALNVSISNIRYDANGVIRFDVVEQQGPIDDTKNSIVDHVYGGELGGSYYHVEGVLAPVQETDGSAKATVVCTTTDHFNGNYTAECETNVAIEALTSRGVDDFVFFVSIVLDSTHYRGYRVLTMASKDFNLTNDDLKLPIMNHRPLAVIRNTGQRGGAQGRKECTEKQVWQRGGGGNAWLETPDGQLEFVMGQHCSAPMWDKANKTLSVRQCLAQCLAQRGKLHIFGDSHMRFIFDEIADRLGIRNTSLELQHFDYSYNHKRLVYKVCRYFDDCQDLFEKSTLSFSLDDENGITNSNSSTPFFLIGCGAWDAAHCPNWRDSLTKLDSLMEAIYKHENLLPGTMALISTPAIPNSVQDSRFFRRNSFLEALSELQQYYLAKMRTKTLFLDFYSLSMGKNNLPVCTNHWVCPAEGNYTVGPVGKAAVDILLTSLCGNFE